MRAAYYDHHGRPEDVLQVGELPDPTPGAGDVCVRVEVSSINPTDFKAMVGGRNDPLGRVVPHSDGAGVIDAVGDGVDPGRIGERVWVYDAQWERPGGTAAEFVVLPEAQVVPMADGVSFEAAASVPIPALTAHRCLFADGDPRGRTVLVLGATGRVGWYAAQLAALAGARVLATGGGEDGCAQLTGAEHLGSFGVEVFDHRDHDLAARIRAATDGRGVDHVVDVEFGANLPTVLDLVTPNGIIATYSSMAAPTFEFPFYTVMRLNLTLRFVYLYTIPADAKRAAVAAVRDALDEGALTHRVGFTTGLDQILDAYREIERGDVRGSVLVSVAGAR